MQQQEEPAFEQQQREQAFEAQTYEQQERAIEAHAVEAVEEQEPQAAEEEQQEPEFEAQASTSKDAQNMQKVVFEISTTTTVSRDRTADWTGPN